MITIEVQSWQLLTAIISVVGVGAFHWGYTMHRMKALENEFKEFRKEWRERK